MGSYDQLIVMTNNILNENIVTADEKRRHLVEIAMAKRKKQFVERLKCNKQLVNEFSIILMDALKIITEKYLTIEFFECKKNFAGNIKFNTIYYCLEKRRGLPQYRKVW